MIKSTKLCARVREWGQCGREAGTGHPCLSDDGTIIPYAMNAGTRSVRHRRVYLRLYGRRTTFTEITCICREDCIFDRGPREIGIAFTLLSKEHIIL